MLAGRSTSTSVSETTPPGCNGSEQNSTPPVTCEPISTIGECALAPEELKKCAPLTARKREPERPVVVAVLGLMAEMVGGASCVTEKAAGIEPAAPLGSTTLRS